ncbi:uncharacterized protein ARMOST_08697 [Armillaria ostoyae]|uniref:Uncharacterized protein n=1 Tax=Armillaria ostoyae TaxID=47428 RepID=A0A284R9E3_ARMOS|nr:uncharacterized protein ARMOST_08697 [Armillaria ostoyae]
MYPVREISGKILTGACKFPGRFIEFMTTESLAGPRSTIIKHYTMITHTHQRPQRHSAANTGSAGADIHKYCPNAIS